MKETEPPELTLWEGSYGAEAVPIAIRIGNPGQRIYFDADPTTNTIDVSTDQVASIRLLAEDFDLIAELLLRNAMRA